MGAKRKIVIVGSGGRLGAALVRHFGEQPGWEARGIGRKQLDLRGADGVRRALEGEAFDVLVNAAAMTSVDGCEAAAEDAAAVNSVAPAVMATVCEERGSRMVQVSTDYVYNGAAPGEKSEEAPLAPLGAYARSKLDGERGALQACERALVLRTAWVFGEDRESFLDSILWRAVEQEAVRAIGDKVSSVCWAALFGGMLEGLLSAADARGVVNVCQRGTCSWVEYARCGFEAAKAEGVPFRAEGIEAMALDAMEAFVAPRPRFTGMATTRLEALSGAAPVAWEEAVEGYVRTVWVPRWRARQT